MSVDPKIEQATLQLQSDTDRELRSMAKKLKEYHEALLDKSDRIKGQHYIKTLLKPKFLELYTYLLNFPEEIHSKCRDKSVNTEKLQTYLNRAKNALSPIKEAISHAGTYLDVRRPEDDNRPSTFDEKMSLIECATSLHTAANKLLDIPTY